MEIEEDMSTSSGSQRKRTEAKKKTFKIGTFNVRGLTQDMKQKQLSCDMNTYKLDVLCIQETKVKELTNIDIEGNRLICLESESPHYGNGFLVSRKWKNNIYRFWRVNDRISVLQLQTEKSREKNTNNEKGWRSRMTGETTMRIEKSAPKDHLINVINVYAPTSEKVEKNENIVQKIYQDIENLINELKCSTSVTFIGGDFNAKVGKKLKEEEINCLGQYSKGDRNRSGELLIEFCEKNKLFIANTAFQHPARHITTWSQHRKSKATNKMQHIYNQIDYIMVNKSNVQNLKQARSYAGTETISDHRLVIMSFEDNWTKLYKNANRKKKDDGKKRFNTQLLANDDEMRKKYEIAIEKELQENEISAWDEMQMMLIKAAEETIGIQEPERRGEVNDSEIKELSKKQKDIHMLIMAESEPIRVRELKAERKKIQKNIQKNLTAIREREIDAIVHDIENAKDDARMFKAVNNIKRRKYENPTVHDSKGKNATTPNQVYKIVAEHFKNVFYKEEEAVIERHIGPPKPLNKPITGNEITKATSTMANNKGYVHIPMELVKYAPQSAHNKIATLLNNIFEKHADIDTGSADLIPLQKPPPKKKGPVKNLRPINLLLLLRKILSKVGLRRAAEDIVNFLSFTQCAYTSGRSTTVIVWAYRWLLAKVQVCDIVIYVTGIDMSSAFDTIHRDELLEISKQFLDEDGQRILRVLLSNTNIRIKIKGADTEPIETNIGGPQGDSYSGPQFTTYFENALEDVRIEVGIDLANQTLPEEFIYADDYDNLTTDINKQQQFKDKAPDILRGHNLNVNDDKTEETILKRNKHDKKNKTTNEPWRETIKLGSKLGDREDIKRRKQLSQGAMNKMDEILKRRKIVNRKKRLKLYSAIVRSVLTYNSCTWGMSEKDESDINAFHRRQLRRVLGVKYPTKMSNEAVYRLSKAKPLSVEITKSRWKMFGHVLRMGEKTPARLAMKFYFTETGHNKFRGRPRTTIVTTINRDIIRAQKKFENFDIKPIRTELDLRNVRVKALNRKHWQKRVSMITAAAYSAHTST